MLHPHLSPVVGELFAAVQADYVGLAFLWRERPCGVCVIAAEKPAEHQSITAS
jgi:hypothetical protein